MISSAAFKSSNTLRITVPRVIQRALNLLPGQRVMYTHTRPGVVELRNADALIEELATKRKI